MWTECIHTSTSHDLCPDSFTYSECRPLSWSPGKLEHILQDSALATLLSVAFPSPAEWGAPTGAYISISTLCDLLVLFLLYWWKCWDQGSRITKSPLPLPPLKLYAQTLCCNLSWLVFPLCPPLSQHLSIICLKKASYVPGMVLSTGYNRDGNRHSPCFYRA